MKTIFKVLFTLFFLTILQFCKAQEKEYNDFYNIITPKLQNIAEKKNMFYNQEFSKFYDSLTKKKISIIIFGYDSKIANAKDYYVLRIYFTDNKTISYAIDNKLRLPVATITFKDKIPFEIIQLTKQYAGEWNDNILTFFSNQIIEKIDFYGINGINSSNIRAR